MKVVAFLLNGVSLDQRKKSTSLVISRAKCHTVRMHGDYSHIINNRFLWTYIMLKINLKKKCLYGA